MIAGYEPSMINPLLDHKYTDFNQFTGPNRYIVPFLACGDLSAYDSDKSYPLNLGAAKDAYKYHEPVQKPIDPPYKRAMAEKRGEDVEKVMSELDINKPDAWLIFECFKEYRKSLQHIVFDKSDHCLHGQNGIWVKF